MKAFYLEAEADGRQSKIKGSSNRAMQVSFKQMNKGKSQTTITIEARTTKEGKLKVTVFGVDGVAIYSHETERGVARKPITFIHKYKSA